MAAAAYDIKNIGDIVPADYNPRKISSQQLKRLKKSLNEFGDLSGFVVNVRTGNLIGGHQRLKCLPKGGGAKKTKTFFSFKNWNYCMGQH